MIRRVLFCGAWDDGDGYPRATALRQGLIAAGVEVVDCRVAGNGRGKQRLVAAPWRWPGWLFTTAWRRLRLGFLLRGALRRVRPEVVVVPYPGQHLVGDVARIARVPVVLDLFLSAYDTAVLDRRWFAPDSLPARLLRRLDRDACRAADLVLVDTEANATFVAELTELAPTRFAVLPIGDPAAPPHVVPYAPAIGGGLRLLFFGTGVPLHGLATLIDAVAMVPAVTLELIGGTATERAYAVARLGERLVLGAEFVARAELQRRIEAAHLVAGVFGSSDKARRVVPFKLVHALAAGRPVVTAETPAVRAVLGAGDGVFFVPAADAAALATCLGRLAAEPGLLTAAAAGARLAYDRQFAVARSGAQLADVLTRLATPTAAVPS